MNLANIQGMPDVIEKKIKSFKNVSDFLQNLKRKYLHIFTGHLCINKFSLGAMEHFMHNQLLNKENNSHILLKRNLLFITQRVQ